MQGRLSPQTSKGYQAFPDETWESEFEIAAKMGFSHIEWVLDCPNPLDNPLIADPKRVAALASSSVPIKSVCADFLMQSVPWQWREVAVTLQRLLESMQLLGATHVVAPFVDDSSLLLSKVSRRQFEFFIDEWLKISVGTGVKLSIESDLGPKAFSEYVGHFPSEQIGINYDIGNSAYMGYSWQEELANYGNRINLLHVKDRVLGGGSVPLGSGDADVPSVLSLFTTQVESWDGLITMQAFRGPEGIPELTHQLLWLETQFLDQWVDE